MKCPRCQQENPPQVKFCLECAAPLAVRCANCGTPLPAGAKFCFECATPINGPGTGPRFAGKREQAQGHLTTATTMYREMEMTYWLYRAEAERELAG